MENEKKFSSELSARSQKELKQSFTWYEQQQKGLGTRFINEVDDWINTIKENPETFAIKYKWYREAAIPTFPFLIIYRAYKRKRIIRVFSVFHTSQNPKKKYK